MIPIEESRKNLKFKTKKQIKNLGRKIEKGTMPAVSTPWSLVAVKNTNGSRSEAEAKVLLSIQNY